MDHWLDGLARAVASERFSRRTLMRRAAKAGFAPVPEGDRDL